MMKFGKFRGGNEIKEDRLYDFVLCSHNENLFVKIIDTRIKFRKFRKSKLNRVYAPFHPALLQIFV